MDHVGLLQEERGSRSFEIGAFFLDLIERMNYGGFKIFMCSLMMKFVVFFSLLPPKLCWTKLLI